MNKQLITLALCRSLPSTDNADNALWLPLIPLGKFGGRDGRHWDNHDAEGVIKNTVLPFILDVDHTTAKPRLTPRQAVG